MRLLPLLAASATSGGRTPLALDSEPARGASFRDVLSKLTASPTLDLGLAWTGDNSQLAIQLAIRDLPDRQTQILDSLRIESNSQGARIVLEALWDTENSRPGA